MAHAIPVSVSSLAGVPLPGDLVAEVFWVTANGEVVERLDRFPVQGGLAVYNGRPLGAPHLRWAIMIRDFASASAVFRSGPLRRLPGPPSNTRPTGRITIFVCGKANLQLPEVAPDFVAGRLENLPPPLDFVGVDLGSDDEGHYLVTVRGRMETVSRVMPFTYQRALRLVGGLDPGRPARAVEARAEGTARIRGANVRPFAAALDAAITTAVEALLGAATLNTGQLCLSVAGGPFVATTVSVSAVALDSPLDTIPGTEAYATLAAGAIAGGVTGPAQPLAS